MTDKGQLDLFGQQTVTESTITLVGANRAFRDLLKEPKQVKITEAHYV